MYSLFSRFRFLPFGVGCMHSSLEHVFEAKRKLAAQLAGTRGVLAVGVGIFHGTFGLSVQVSAALDATLVLPDALDGFAVRREIVRTSRV